MQNVEIYVCKKLKIYQGGSKEAFSENQGRNFNPPETLISSESLPMMLLNSDQIYVAQAPHISVFNKTDAAEDDNGLLRRL